mgnify:FL=1
MTGLFFLVVTLTLSGCSTLWEQKVTDTKSASIPWADDKGIMLDTDTCPKCFHLGPLGYEEMRAALLEM